MGPMRPTRRAALSFAMLVALAAPCKSARAADPSPSPVQVQAARDLFAAATKDEDAQRWADALEKLRRVAEVKLTAGVRYHIAFCEEKLGQTKAALAHYTEAQSAAQREHDKDVLDLVTPDFLAALRVRVPTLTIEMPDAVPDADVTLDDHAQPKGSWGVAVPVDPGTHRIEAHAPGRVSFVKEMTLHEREVTVLDVSLPPLAPTPVPVTVVAPKGAVAHHAEPTVSDASPTHSRSITAPLVTTIGAVVLVGVGIGAFVLAGNAQSTGQSQCASRTSGGCDDLRSPVRDWDSVALGAWIGAGILATTAIVLWASPPRDARDARPASAARITTTGSRLVLEGSF